MLKKILLIITFAAIALPLSTLAASPSSVPTPSPTATDVNSLSQDWQGKLNSYHSAAQDKKLDALKELGTVLIGNRINLMENIKSRIESIPKTTSDDKNTLLSEVDQTISDLEALKTRIQSETSIEALKTDIRTIFNTSKVYSVVAPSDLGESLVLRGNYILGKLQEIQTKVSKLVDEQATAGNDTTDLESQLRNVTNKLVDAQSQLNIANTQFKAMTPADSAGAKTAREEGKTAFKRAKDDLNAANTILKQIVAALKLMKPLSSPSPLASPSA